MSFDQPKLTTSEENSLSTPLIFSSNEIQGSQNVVPSPGQAVFTDKTIQEFQNAPSLANKQTGEDAKNVTFPDEQPQAATEPQTTFISVNGHQIEQVEAKAKKSVFGNEHLTKLDLALNRIDREVKSETKELEDTRDKLTENLHSFSTRFHNFADRAVKHLLNLLPSFKFFDTSINNIKDRKYDYNLKTNQLSTTNASITINKGAQEIYTNTKNLEVISTFFSDLKENVNQAFNTQNNNNLSRGNIPSDNQNNKYSLYTTTNANNQQAEVTQIKNSIDALNKLDNLDQIQNKDLKTILKAGIANIFAVEKDNKTILEALKKNLNDAEDQLKKASSFKQRISAWWDSVGSDKTRFISTEDVQYMEIIKKKDDNGNYYYVDKNENLIKNKDGNKITKDNVILANKALHDSREALRADIAKYQKQIKELKKLTNTCKEISNRFGKSNDKAIKILSNLSFVKTDQTNILTYLTSDTNKQEAITEKTQSLLNSKLEEYQKILANNDEEIRLRKQEISTQLNGYKSIKSNNALTKESQPELLTAIKDGISYQSNFLEKNYKLLSSTQKSFSALFSLNPNNEDLKILCNNFKTQTEGYNALINTFEDITNDVELDFTVPEKIKGITLEENLAQISIEQKKIDQWQATKRIQNCMNKLADAIKDKNSKFVKELLLALKNEGDSNLSNNYSIASTKTLEFQGKKETVNFFNLVKSIQKLPDYNQKIALPGNQQINFAGNQKTDTSLGELATMIENKAQKEILKTSISPSIATKLSEISAIKGTEQNGSIAAPASNQSVSPKQSRPAEPLPSLSTPNISVNSEPPSGTEGNKFPPQLPPRQQPSAQSAAQNMSASNPGGFPQSDIPPAAPNTPPAENSGVNGAQIQTVQPNLPNPIITGVQQKPPQSQPAGTSTTVPPLPPQTAPVAVGEGVPTAPPAPPPPANFGSTAPTGNSVVKGAQGLQAQLPNPQHGRADLLSQIQQGMTLRRVERAPAELPEVENTSDITTALKNAMAARRPAVVDDQDDGEDDDDEWSD